MLVVAGENRLSGQSRGYTAIQTLAQVGDAEDEVPLGASVSAYYGLVASRYMHPFGVREVDPQLAVLMRPHAASYPGAHFRTPITAPTSWRQR